MLLGYFTVWVHHSCQWGFIMDNVIIQKRLIILDVIFTPLFDTKATLSKVKAMQLYHTMMGLW